MFAGARRRTRTPSTVSHPARARGAVETTLTSWPAVRRPAAMRATTVSAPPSTSGGYRFDIWQTFISLCRPEAAISPLRQGLVKCARHLLRSAAPREHRGLHQALVPQFLTQRLVG